MRAHEVIRQEIQVLGALLVNLDRDRVLKVQEQLDEILPVFESIIPVERDPLGAQFLHALAEEAPRRLRNLHHTRGASCVDVDELRTALLRLRDERRKRQASPLALREVREHNRGGGHLKGRPPARAVRPQVGHWVHHAILATKRVAALVQRAHGARCPLAEDAHHYYTRRPLLLAGQHAVAQQLLQLLERLVLERLVILNDENGPRALRDELARRDVVTELARRVRELQHAGACGGRVEAAHDGEAAFKLELILEDVLAHQLWLLAAAHALEVGMAPCRVRVVSRAEAHVAFGRRSLVEAVRAVMVTPVEEHTDVLAQAEALKVRNGGQLPLFPLE